MSPVLLASVFVAYIYGVEGHPADGAIIFPDSLAVRIGESSCTTPNSLRGKCMSIYQCPALLTILNKDIKTPEDIEFLKKSQCGFIGTVPTVCCPDPCLTPDGQQGQCINIYSCRHLTDLLRPPITNENKLFVQNSKCQSSDQYTVCCGPAPVSQVEVGNCETRLTADPPDPKTECCGVDGRVGNKIHGGTATTIDQYPWLAIIEYLKSGSLKLLCGAALISGKYVLTAGHCVAGPILEYGTPTNIRLGEYDTGNEGPDCTSVEAGGDDCTYGLTVIPIEQTIPHPDYNPVSQNRRNDIALIRLKEMAPFTDFIRPICLPRTDLTLAPPTNFTLFAAGWGAVSTTQPRSKIKLHVDLPYVEKSTCFGVYKKRQVTLWDKQMCAGGEAGKDSCKGDSGGPLMFENGRTFEAIGVVSFGPLPCGIEDVPGVYTKVYEYNDWIRKTIKP